MDGGSTDGTLALLSGYPHLRVHSQVDEGIYDALNKGIRLVTGEVIGFLNTDDLYEPAIFGSIVQTFKDHPRISALVGGATIFYDKCEGKTERLATFPCIPQKELLLRATQGAPVFNAWFFRKRLFDELGGFDTQYRYVADRDLLIRMALRDTPFESLDRTFYHYRMHPGSYTLSGQDSGEAGFMFECRDLAEHYIQDKRTSPYALKCFRIWHSQITMDQIITAWRKKAFRRISAYIITGLRHNRFGWPKVFMDKTIERLSVVWQKFSTR